MKRYDVIVIGSGAGMNVASRAVSSGLNVAVVDGGPLGGTCLNRGCIPSKIMLYPADVIRMVEDARSVGVHAVVERVDFDLIMKRVWDLVLRDRRGMELGIQQSDRIDFYNSYGSFVSDHTLEIGRKRVRGDKIVIASGARPLIPPIEGIEDVGYLTSDTVFDIDAPPKSMIIVGGGYIAAEFAHFFSAIGTKVTVLGRNVRLLPQEEPEVSDLFERKISGHCTIRTNHEAVGAGVRDGLKYVLARTREDDQTREYSAEEVLVATGRRSNSDVLRPEKSGVKTDARGWIIVDPFLRTTQENIWALGDATGKHMFRHAANYEAEVVWMNAFSGHQHSVDDHAVPHAVFSHPQVASVGMRQEEAERDHDILVGVKRYYDTAKGYAMAEEDGFVKVIVDSETGRILGAHVIGPDAAILVQQLVYLMNTDSQDYIPLARAQTIHPALSEVVVGAFGNLRPVGEHEYHHHEGGNDGG